MKPLVRLPFNFDVAEILAELPDKWVNHFIPEFAEQGNSALLLVTTNGEQNHAHQAPMLPTPDLLTMDYTRSIWDMLDLPFERSRLMKISPKGNMPEHTDTHPYWNDKCRIHIPVKTNDKVTFYCGGEQAHMEESSCWAIDNAKPHKVTNNGETDRIHLVIDAGLEWLHNRFK